MNTNFMPLDWHVNDNYPNAESFIGPCSFASASSSDGLQQQLADHLLIIPGKFQFNVDDTLAMPGNVAPLAPAAMAIHLGERIFCYPLGFVVITQLTGAFAVFRSVQ